MWVGGQKERVLEGWRLTRKGCFFQMVFFTLGTQTQGLLILATKISK